jgi:hypothetical protein
VPLGLVLEGGYEPAALAESVEETLAAVGGNEPARSAAAEPPLTLQAVALIGRYWPL